MNIIQNMICCKYPVIAKHFYNICTMPGQRRRRWADIVQILEICLCLLGNYICLIYHCHIQKSQLGICDDFKLKETLWSPWLKQTYSRVNVNSTTVVYSLHFSSLTLSSLSLPFSSSSTTSRELLSQFSTCSE